MIFFQMFEKIDKATSNVLESHDPSATLEIEIDCVNNISGCQIMIDG